MVDVQPRSAEAIEHAAPEAGTDRRKLIPELGLKEYWYPAIEARKVRNKPVGLMIMKEQIVFFKGKDGLVKALWNVCPHRGGSLMHGDSHFEGTVSCPYHGWTYDGDGNVLAVLPEGPESKIPGKVKARVYPTQTLRGMVFIWMGEGEPAPIEEDVPLEFFTDNGILLFGWEVWPINWRPANENALEAHVPYVHRDSWINYMIPFPQMGPRGIYTKIVNNRAAKGVYPGYGDAVKEADASGGDNEVNVPKRPKGPTFTWDFPALDSKWPKNHIVRSMISRFFRWTAKRRYKWSPMDQSEEWGSMQHHLPAMVRVDFNTHMYTRNNVPIDEYSTRQIYYHYARGNSWLGRLYEKLQFHMFHRWALVSNFSNQDFRAAAPQRYDTAEYLSSTDSHLVVWRRMMTRARGMEDLKAGKLLPTTKAEDASRLVQTEVGMTLEWEPGDDHV
jgi:phenylpropionate dioxygenase-like ring-hydroxylating dioxygenase large terminal subunit